MKSAGPLCFGPETTTGPSRPQNGSTHGIGTKSYRTFVRMSTKGPIRDE